MGSMTVPVIVLVIIAVLLIGWGISTRNRIKMMEVKIEEAKSGIDIALIKRYDILTESLNVAKGYAAHEKRGTGAVDRGTVRHEFTADPGSHGKSGKSHRKAENGGRGISPALFQPAV